MNSCKMTPDQKLVMIDTIEDVGLETLNLALIRVLCHSDCLAMPVDERDSIYRFLHGASLVINDTADTDTAI